MDNYPIIDLQPRHIARGLAVVVLLPVFYIFGIQGVTTEREIDLLTGEINSTSNLGSQLGKAAIWILLALGFAYAERVARARNTQWPNGIHRYLVDAKLAGQSSATTQRQSEVRSDFSSLDHAADHDPSSDADGSVQKVGFTVKPYHAARIAAAVAFLTALNNLPGIPWLIVAAASLYVEWHTRTKAVSWPPAIGSFLDRLTVKSSNSTTTPPTSTGENDHQSCGRTVSLRPHSMTEIFANTRTAVQRNWKVALLFPIALIIAGSLAVGLLTIAAVYIGRSAFTGTASFGAGSTGSDFAANPGTLFAEILILYVAVVLLIWIPLDAVVTGVTVTSAAHAARSSTVRLREALAATRSRMFALCRLSLIFSAIFYLILLILFPVASIIITDRFGWIAFLASSIALSGATLVATVLFSLAPVPLMLEGTGVFASLKRSAILVRPAWLRLTAVHAAWGLGTITLILMVNSILSGLGSLIGLAVAFPIFRTFQTLLYADLRTRAGGGAHPGGLHLDDASASTTSSTALRAQSTPSEDSSVRTDDRSTPSALPLPTRERTDEPPQNTATAPPTPVDVPTSAPEAIPISPIAAFTPPGQTHPAPPSAESTPADRPEHTGRAQDTPAQPALDPAVFVSPGVTEDAFVTPSAAHDTPPAPIPSLSTNTNPMTVPAPPACATVVAAGPRRRPPVKMAIALVALGLVLGLAISGLVYWFPSRETVETKPSPTDGLSYTFPDAPTASWQISASSVFAGAQFASPTPAAGLSRPGFIDLGDTLITTAVLPNTDAEAQLVAIDASDGTIRWIARDRNYDICASKTLDDGLLPCYTGRGLMGPEYINEVTFVRIFDGSIDHTIDVPDRQISWIEVLDGDVITGGYDGIGRGTTTDLTARWFTPWNPAYTCRGSGDEIFYGATNEFVHFGNDAGQLVLDAKTGNRLIPEAPQAVTVYPGHGLVAWTCAPDDPEDRTAVVLDQSGTLLRTHDINGGYTSTLATTGSPARYVIDGTAYDFTDGSRTWTHRGEVADIIDDTVLFIGDTLTAVDFHTGEIRWTQQLDVESSYTVPFMWLTDRQRVIFGLDDTLRAVNLRDGTTDWVLPGASGNPVRAGHGIATASQAVITYYAPTGGPVPTESVSDDVIKAGGDTGPLTVARCGTPPALTPVAFRTEADGLVVRMELRAACPSGDIVSTDALRVAISEQGKNIASGVFDFSKSPLYLPPTTADGPQRPTTVQQDFRFPIGTFWRLPTPLENQSDPSSNQASSGGTKLVECTDQGVSRGPRKGEYHAPPVGGEPTAIGPGTPATGDAEAAALDALRAQADADRPTVQTVLADKWLPQLSSKYPGLVAPDVDGRMVTWSATEILNQHMRMRLQYPEVRLLWSDDWRTFDLNGWWITIAGDTFDDPEAANGWCDTNAIPKDECFAKQVSNSQGPQGTTRYR